MPVDLGKTTECDCCCGCTSISACGGSVVNYCSTTTGDGTANPGTSLPTMGSDGTAGGGSGVDSENGVITGFVLECLGGEVFGNWASETETEFTVFRDAQVFMEVSQPSFIDDLTTSNIHVYTVCTKGLEQECATNTINLEKACIGTSTTDPSGELTMTGLEITCQAGEPLLVWSDSATGGNYTITMGTQSIGVTTDTEYLLPVKTDYDNGVKVSVTNGTDTLDVFYYGDECAGTAIPSEDCVTEPGTLYLVTEASAGMRYSYSDAYPGSETFVITDHYKTPEETRTGIAGSNPPLPIFLISNYNAADADPAEIDKNQGGGHIFTHTYEFATALPPADEICLQGFYFRNNLYRSDGTNLYYSSGDSYNRYTQVTNVETITARNQVSDVIRLGNYSLQVTLQFPTGNYKHERVMTILAWRIGLKATV